MNKKKIFILSIYLLIAMISLCGCSKSEEDNKLEKKVGSEVDYLDKKIIGVMNKLNNITLENYEVKSKEISLKDEGKGGQGERS